MVKRHTTPRSGLLAFFPRSGSRRSRHPVACSDFISTDRHRQHVAAPNTYRDSLAVEMASAEKQQERPLRSRNISVPSDRPSMLPLLSSPLRIFSPLPSLSAVSHRPDRSGGFLWRWDLASPTTFYPCGLERPSPDALCVFRRELESLGEATPSIHRLFRKARTVYGPPPPAPRPTSDSALKHGLRLFQDGPLW